jgi:hypothetical protein
MAQILEVKPDQVELLLKKFGKQVKNGTIIDKKSGETVTCHYTGVDLTLQNFGGILPGSTIFISNSEYAMSAYVADKLIS